MTDDVGRVISGPGAWQLRGMVAGLAIMLAGAVFVFQDAVPGRVRAAAGVVCFILVVIACSSDIRAIRWRTVAWGLALQLTLAVTILRFEVGGVRPGYEVFSGLAAVVTQFLEFTNTGSEFVFGVLADQEEMGRLFPNGLVLAFAALPIIIFVSSVFTVLYHLGVLQLLVKLMARLMMPLMRTSGAETLSAVANVFMGQTEAPIIVKPYIPTMTQSELLTLMTGGLATIAGSVLGVYISLWADPVAILTTSVMAAPCGLYLSKILMPETGATGDVQYRDGGRGPRACECHRRGGGWGSRRDAPRHLCRGDVDCLPGVHRHGRFPPRPGQPRAVFGPRVRGALCAGCRAAWRAYCRRACASGSPRYQTGHQRVCGLREAGR